MVEWEGRCELGMHVTVVTVEDEYFVGEMAGDVMYAVRGEEGLSMSFWRRVKSDSLVEGLSRRMRWFSIS